MIMLAPSPVIRLEDSVPTGDPAAIGRLYRWGGEKLVHDLVHLFQELTPERLRTLRTAIAVGDAAAAEGVAHGLGSSCGQLGAMRMRRLCLRVEALAAQGSVAGAVPLLPELEEEYALHGAWLARETAAEEGAA